MCRRLADMSEEPTTTEQAKSPELEREERRLERLRLVGHVWAPDERYDDPDPDPPPAAWPRSPAAGGRPPRLGPVAERGRSDWWGAGRAAARASTSSGRATRSS